MIPRRLGLLCYEPYAAVPPYHSRQAERLGQLLGEHKIDLFITPCLTAQATLAAEATMATGGGAAAILYHTPENTKALADLRVMSTLSGAVQTTADACPFMAVLPMNPQALLSTMGLLAHNPDDDVKACLVLVNVAGYWNGFIEQLRRSTQDGVINPRYEQLIYRVVNSVEELVALFDPVITGVPQKQVDRGNLRQLRIQMIEQARHEQTLAALQKTVDRFGPSRLADAAKKLIIPPPPRDNTAKPKTDKDPASVRRDLELELMLLPDKEKSR